MTWKAALKYQLRRLQSRVSIFRTVLIKVNRTANILPFHGVAIELTNVGQRTVHAALSRRQRDEVKGIASLRFEIAFV